MTSAEDDEQHRGQPDKRCLPCRGNHPHPSAIHGGETLETQCFHEQHQTRGRARFNGRCGALFGADLKIPQFIRPSYITAVTPFKPGQRGDAFRCSQNCRKFSHRLSAGEPVKQRSYKRIFLVLYHKNLQICHIKKKKKKTRIVLIM